MALLVRHAKDKDGKVTPEGREATIAWARALPKQYRLIICAPSPRAKETAEIIASVIGAPIDIDDRLGEVGFAPGFEELRDAVMKEMGDEMRGISTPIAAFRHDGTRDLIEAESLKLLPWARSLGDDVIVVSHGLRLSGLKVASSGAAFGPESWRGNNFPNLQALTI